jgi:type I restriction enzyme S subunit
MGIDLPAAHLALVTRLLAEHAPGCEVRAFGSRVAGTARRFSDLDLAVMGAGDGPDAASLERLREAFEESELPIRVDVIDWRSAGPAMRAAVERHSIVLQESGS